MEIALLIGFGLSLAANCAFWYLLSKWMQHKNVPPSVGPIQARTPQDSTHAYCNQCHALVARFSVRPDGIFCLNCRPV